MKKKSMFLIIRTILHDTITLGEEFTVDSIYGICKELEPDMRWNKDYIYQILTHYRNANILSQKTGIKTYQKTQPIPENNLCDLALLGRQIKFNNEKQ